jgi:multidrug efflux system outer membrane protein
MRKPVLILSLTVVLIAGGCAVGPNFTRPEVYTDEYFMFDSIREDSTEVLAWWEIFGDAELDTLVNRALRNNKDVRIAASRVAQAWAAVGYYRADMYPKLDVSAGAMRGNYFGSPTPLQNNFFGLAQLAWELDFWGKYRRATEAARAEMLASEHGMRAAQIGLISAVVINYFQLLDFRQRLAVSENTLAARDSSLRIIRERFKEGIISELDVNQAEIQKAIAASAVPYHNRQIAFAENALSILLGENPGPIITEKELTDYEPIQDIPPGMPSLLLERRPDIMQAEALYRAQNARIGVAVAMRFPSISLTGSLGAASNSLVSLNTGALAWSVGGNLLGPVFNFNKNKRRVDIERFRAEEFLLQYENTVLNSFREVEDALIEISTLKEELSAREQQVKAAMNAENLSQARYDRGVTSYLEVLETQRSSFDAQISYASAYQQLLSSYIKLYRALGGGWISPEEEQMTEE